MHWTRYLNIQCMKKLGLQCFRLLTPCLCWSYRVGMVSHIQYMMHYKQGCALRITPTFMWCEQAVAEWAWCVNFFIACCHSAQFCTLATHTLWTLQNCAVTSTWRQCQICKLSKWNLKWCKFVVKRRGCCYDCLVSAVLHAPCTTNKMCADKATPCQWHKQTAIERTYHVTSIVACCHSVKLHVLTAWALQSQHLWCRISSVLQYCRNIVSFFIGAFSEVLAVVFIC